MGRDKGLMPYNGKAWAAHIAGQLEYFVEETYVSLRTTQREAYENIFETRQMIFDLDEVPVEGPLKGLLCAHLAFPEKTWLAAACDMISINEAALLTLVEAFHKNPGYDAWLFRHNGELEPLCAIYSGDWLGRFIKNAAACTDFSLQRNLAGEKCFVIEAGEEIAAALKNFNTDEDCNA